MKKNKSVKLHHRVLASFVRLVSFVYTRAVLGYRCKDKYKFRRGESVIVLSNHQTDADPFCILTSFKKAVFPVATDSIFSGKGKGAFLKYCGLIPKKKGSVDLRATRMMKNTLAGGGSLLLFPEGNRFYAEFQYYVSPSLATFIKRSGATVVLFNLHGGSGVFPRFAAKRRKGKFFGEIRRVIRPEEYDKMSSEQLFDEIMQGIKVFDSDSGEKYRSKRRAEYAERMFFVCPRCGKMQTIYSSKHEIFCKHCGKLAEYTEDLHLKGEDGFPFTRLVEWWQFQKKAVREMPVVDGGEIFVDDGVKAFLFDPFEKRRLLAKDRLTLTASSLRCGDFELPLSTVTGASVVSGKKLTLTADGHDFLFVGDDKFNPLKYVFAFNKLDTQMRLDGSDKHFNLED